MTTHCCNHVLLSANKRFNYNVIYLTPQQVSVNMLLFQRPHPCTKTPFMPIIVNLVCFVLYKLLTFLVHTVVGQMYEFVHVVLIWVLLDGESSEAFIVYVHTKGIKSSNQYIYP